MEFNDYFDRENRHYNLFSLDEGDIWVLQNFVEQIRHMDLDSTIYVCTYGYEIVNSKGEKSTYADALWIDTVLPVFAVNASYSFRFSSLNSSLNIFTIPQSRPSFMALQMNKVKFVRGKYGCVRNCP